MTNIEWLYIIRCLLNVTRATIKNKKKTHEINELAALISLTVLCVKYYSVTALISIISNVCATVFVYSS